MSTEKKIKMFVLGLDGGSLNFVQPWIEGGYLPNFKTLMELGCSGDLESCLPPVTMPAWRVYSTGKYPGKLGVFWHQQLDMKNRTVITPNASMIHSADYWDYLNRAGFRTGIFGMPDLYPPRPVDGFVVCGGPSVSSTEYSYPQNWAAELEREVNYEVCLKGDFFGAEADSPIVAEALNVIEKTFRGADYIYRRDPVDFLMTAIFDINRIQHFFYDQKPSLQAWQIADDWLGKFAPQFEYIAIMSDHGTESLERAFFLNVWLKQEGYLFTKFKPMDILPKLGINRTTAGKIISILGLRRFLDFESVRKYSSLLPSASGVFGEFGNQAVLSRTDWSKTRVIALAQGPIYINRELVKDQDEYERLRSELVEKLEAMQEPRSGKRVFKKVYRSEEIYQGPHAEMAPDLMALNFDEYHNRAGLSQPAVFADSWAWKGNNRHNGMFMLAGPGIRHGTTLKGVRIVDLAPTILHLHGAAVPDDMDGRVLEEAFLPDSSHSLVPIQRQAAIDVGYTFKKEVESDQIISDRLRDLGYIE
ncbi:MAG: hypothetical protein A2Z16_12320 [Chloroflexi bacterium RBG_16_54_18]|nr:MAG: hypothetical protein A2Z16_12320 [Chloroflexi bacterium RBG_16_54_18]